MKLNPDVGAYKRRYTKLRDCINRAQGFEAEKLRKAIGLSSDKLGSLDDIPFIGRISTCGYMCDFT